MAVSDLLVFFVTLSHYDGLRCISIHACSKIHFQELNFGFSHCLWIIPWKLNVNCVRDSRCSYLFT